MPLFQLRPMSRSLYLGSLLLLQFALAAHVAPPLARTFRAHALFASLHDGWTMAVEFAAVALAVGSAAVALAFPMLAFARHATRGRVRFVGLPRRAIAVGVAGAALFTGALAMGAVATLVPFAREALAPLAQTLSVGGTAMMAAGALCAELLRRSIPPVPIADAPWHCTPARVAPLEPLDREEPRLGTIAREESVIVRAA